MKKLFIILFILCLCSPAFAGIYGNIEIGTPIGESIYYSNGTEKQDYSDTYFTNIALGYKNYFFDLVEYQVYAGIFTWASGSITEPTGAPFENIYGFGAKLIFKGIYFRYNHFCAHPVISNKQQHKYYAENRYQYVPDNRSWYLNMTALTIGYEFEIK